MSKDGFGSAIFEKLFPIFTLFETMWRMLRHPFGFDDYVHCTPKQIVSFFFVSAGLSAFFWKFEQRAVDLAASRLDQIINGGNGLVHLIIPKYDISPLMAIPLMILLYSFAFAFVFHGVWCVGRFLLSDQVKRILRKGDGVLGRPLRLIVGACIFSAGLFVLLLTVMPAIAVLLSVNLKYEGSQISFHTTGHSISGILSAMSLLVAMYGGFILFAVTPIWFARIYGLRKLVSYIMSSVVLMIIILPFAFAKPQAHSGFAEEWVSSGFLVYFDYDRDQVGEKGETILRHVAAIAMDAARTGALGAVEIGGATDTAEAAVGAPDLAWQRAVAVGKALISFGVPQEAVFARSLDDGHLLVFTPNNVREPRNRFATIAIRAYGRVINATEPRY